MADPAAEQDRQPAPATAMDEDVEPMTLEGDETEEGDGNDAAWNFDLDALWAKTSGGSTASLKQSIFEYRTLCGRTYHSEIGNASYWGPNDDRHNESLDILHHLHTLVNDGELFQSPVEDPKKILDIGTGTGIWAMDMADMFPKAEVTGTDVSPIQPPYVPPNLKFEIEDCTQEWTFAEDAFDLVHIRYLIGCIPDWYSFFEEAFKHVKPGGYLESYEASPNVYSDDTDVPDAVSEWGPMFIEGGEKIGRTFKVVDDDLQYKAMQKAGFVDIQEKWIRVPSGGWPRDPKLKEIGVFSQFAVLSDVESFILYLTNVHGWSAVKVHVYIARLRRELMSLKYHVYYWQKIVWGRKPDVQRGEAH